MEGSIQVIVEVSIPIAGTKLTSKICILYLVTKSCVRCHMSIILTFSLELA
jgi:hypothetical protein